MTAATPGPRRQDALAALEQVVDPCSQAIGRPMSIVALGLVDHDGITVDGDRVDVSLVLTDPLCVFFRDLSSVIEDVLVGCGFRHVTVSTRSELWTPSRMPVSRT